MRYKLEKERKFAMTPASFDKYGYSPKSKAKIIKLVGVYIISDLPG